MRKVAVLVTIFALVTVAQAAKIRPFVGAGFHLNSQRAPTPDVEIINRFGRTFSITRGLRCSSKRESRWNFRVSGLPHGQRQYDAGDKYVLEPEPFPADLIWTKSNLTSAHFVFGGRVEDKVFSEWLRPMLRWFTYGHVKQDPLLDVTPGDAN